MGGADNKTVMLRHLASHPGELKVTEMQTFDPTPARMVSHLRPWLGSLALLTTIAGGALTVSAQQPAASPGSGYHLEATWKPGGEGGWDYTTVDPAAHRLYVTRTDRVQVIDTEDGKIVGEVPGLEGGHGTALVPDENRGFATSGKSGTVVVFDLKTLKPVGEPIKVGQKPDAIVYEPVSKHVFAFNGESEDASVIDPATAKVVATIALGGGPEFAGSDGKGTLFVNLEDKGETLAIDVQKNSVTHRWSIVPGDGPSGLAVDGAKGRVFAGCHNEQMVVLDAASGKVLATPAIGQGVDACAFDPGTGFAFASCGDGTLTVVKEENGGFPVIEKITTKKGARTMALDPATHAVYLPTAEFEAAPTPAPGQGRVRPKMVPGSFMVLKYVR